MRRELLRAGLLLAASAIAWENPGRAAETIVYSYDSLGRLVRVERSGTASPGTSAAYGYDAADNRTNVTVSVGGAAAPSPPQSPANIPLDMLVTDGGSQPQCATATDDAAVSDTSSLCTQAAPPTDAPPPAPPSEEEPE